MKKDIELGQTVKFVRVDENGTTVEGEGIVGGIFIGPDKRPVVRVVETVGESKNPWNIDMPAINPTDEEKAAYVDHVAKIRKFADDTNAAHKQAVQDANAEIERMNTEFMGAPLEV